MGEHREPCTEGVVLLVICFFSFASTNGDARRLLRFGDCFLKIFSLTNRKSLIIKILADTFF